MKKFLALLLMVCLALPASSLAVGVYSDQTTFNYLYKEEITTMNYLTTSVIANMRSSSNFVDTLVDYDQYGLIVPCLATDWECSEDGLEWTFKIREGCNWYDCEGKEIAPVTAHDFVFALQYVLTLTNESSTADLVTPIIKNAAAYYASNATNEELGVKAVDDYTLVYTLETPCPYFLSMLTYVCFFPAYQPFVEEMDADPENKMFGTTRDTILYNGAYICSSWEPQTEYVWEKNPNYWDAENVFIETVYGRYNAESDSLAPEMFLRGQVDKATVTTAILDEWLDRDDTKDFVHPTRPSAGAMWLILNFNPNFYDEAASENYKLAVNNINFRKSIAHGLDKLKAVSAYDPHNAESQILNTIVPAGFASYAGKDYTDYGDLVKFNQGIFDEAAAIAYRDKAIEELTAVGCTFPVYIPYYYNPATANMGDCNQVVAQQLMTLLGEDYISIEVIQGPSTDYIATVRRPGLWGLFEAGWGPDYADPATYSDPFDLGWTYGSQEYALDESYKTGHIYTKEDFDNGTIDDEELIDTEQMEYNRLVQYARTVTVDVEARYEAFAAADSFLLEQAMVIPLRLQDGGYEVSKLEPFAGPYSAFGVASYRYKGHHILEKSLSGEEYQIALEEWEAGREAALAAMEE